MIGIIGKKIGMSHIFLESGTVVPVSMILAGPCPIVQIKDDKKDGYTAVQLGFGQRKSTSNGSSSSPRTMLRNTRSARPLMYRCSTQETGSRSRAGARGAALPAASSDGDGMVVPNRMDRCRIEE
jgi:ribosomal protein L3